MPSDHLSRLGVPVLALFGSKDQQISAEENAPRVEAALEAAPTDDYAVMVLPDLNHLFQHAKTGALDEYGRIEETFAPQALAIMARWISART